MKDNKQSKNSKEVEAESVAYTVCQHYGIDTSDYSFAYVATWSQGKEMPELKDWIILSTIRSIVKESAYAGTSPSHNLRSHSPPTKKGHPINNINIKENFVDIINKSLVLSIFPST